MTFYEAIEAPPASTVCNQYLRNRRMAFRPSFDSAVDKQDCSRSVGRITRSISSRIVGCVIAVIPARSRPFRGVTRFHSHLQGLYPSDHNQSPGHIWSPLDGDATEVLCRTKRFEWPSVCQHTRSRRVRGASVHWLYQLHTSRETAQSLSARGASVIWRDAQ